MHQLHALALVLTCFLLSACGDGLTTSTGDTSGGADGGVTETSVDPCEGSSIFTSGQGASFVIGQTNFTSSTDPTAPTASNVLEPYGTVSYFDDILYIPDPAQSRILGFSTLPASSGASADLAIGQDDLVSDTPATSATGLKYPTRIQKYDGKYYVLDSGNHRLLRYDSAPNTTGAQASAVVVGDPNLGSAGSGCSDTQLSEPTDFLIVAGKLYIVGGSQNRVLGWNTVPTSAGTPADFVLGKSDMADCSTPSTPSATASNLRNPKGIASDGTKLLVADTIHSRILIWNSLPNTNGAAADVVIGQNSMTTSTSNSGGISDISLYEPFALTVHEGKLYVADFSNHRVLIWDAIPTSNSAAASTVIGQAGFTSRTGAISQTAIKNPKGVFVCANQLYVTQGEDANRISVFEGL